MNEIKQLVSDIFEEVVALRRHLHENPELSFCEHKTAEFICSYLQKLGIPYKSGIAGTGIVGLIEAEGAEKTLLMRVDMDALPMQEETGLSFASKNPGVAHSCGHDAHMAILLGTAKVLMKLRHRLSAHIKLVFQPAEETEGGALPMILDGIMENPHVDAAVGGHVMTDVPVGKVLVKSGEMMASPDDFSLEIHGKG
ncbi:MAG: amidohydrolase, partial [Clostridia bacterium]|nr:amidohydrolase [Clostridia bacterium]